MTAVPLLLKFFIPFFSLLKPSTLSLDDMESAYQKLKEALANHDYQAVELYSQRIYPSTKKMRLTGQLIKNIFTVNKDGFLDTNRLIQGSHFFNITSTSIKPKILFYGISRLEVHYWGYLIALILIQLIILFPPLYFIWHIADIMQNKIPTIIEAIIATLVIPVAYYAILARPLSKNISDLRAYKELYEAWHKNLNEKAKKLGEN
ncbi:hypothetical protein ICN10_09990 [Polynucleobacter sp. 86C-FISCH]|uniref:hypothetical protein n=1 Tax=Polynucleobacter sp. 86C-FISCH TaxID=2689101 RepID=UPI001C0BB5B2|nr:hypothetical protein [Polynucleobacter sp. 86C-FISCH]MBU3596728.1 hypothetical protein [Polynucleobacter sp. 86C-FISCH]